MAEIEDNQNFLDNEAGHHRKLSQHSYYRNNQSQPQTPRTPLSKTINSNMSQVFKFFVTRNNLISLRFPNFKSYLGLQCSNLIDVVKKVN